MYTTPVNVARDGVVAGWHYFVDIVFTIYDTIVILYVLNEKK